MFENFQNYTHLSDRDIQTVLSSYNYPNAEKDFFKAYKPVLGKTKRALTLIRQGAKESPLSHTKKQIRKLKPKPKSKEKYGKKRGNIRTKRMGDRIEWKYPNNLWDDSNLNYSPDVSEYNRCKSILNRLKPIWKMNLHNELGYQEIYLHFTYQTIYNGVVLTSDIDKKDNYEHKSFSSGMIDSDNQMPLEDLFNQADLELSNWIYQVDQSKFDIQGISLECFLLRDK